MGGYRYVTTDEHDQAQAAFSQMDLPFLQSLVQQGGSRRFLAPDTYDDVVSAGRLARARFDLSSIPERPDRRRDQIVVAALASAETRTVVSYLGQATRKLVRPRVLTAAERKTEAVRGLAEDA